MAVGPGKYDDICTHARETAKAEAAMVIIVNGDRGCGFSCQGSPDSLLALADMIELVLAGIRAEMAKDLATLKTQS